MNMKKASFIKFLKEVMRRRKRKPSRGNMPGTVPPLVVLVGLAGLLYGGIVVAFWEGERSGNHLTPIALAAGVITALALVNLALSPALAVVLSVV